MIAAFYGFDKGLRIGGNKMGYSIENEDGLLKN
jgi:hypothetical protein